ncbi:MFS transporter [Viridibacillus arvi]|uniref:MFS transporter n=1 Tax=Viridibacillus arvi TaxID=263475 RepID=UPI00187B9B32|nr:MFS transporter [Viridibacillus sp. JNUCC-6]QOV10245.1 MFS transporter [Viridibacillus sp. JNUCC-6]
MKTQNIYYAITSSRSLLIQMVFTLNAIYYVINAGLNPLQLVLIGTIMEVSVFLCEMPTGLVADHYGRKRSLFIGTFIIGIAHLLEGIFPAFWSIAIASGLWGLGWTFISGAEEAWIADELEGKNLDSVFLKGAQFSSLGRFFGILLSVFIATLFSVQVTIIIAGILLVLLAFGVLSTMPETKFVKISRKKDISAIHHLITTIRHGARQIKGNTMLVSIAIITILLGLASEGFDRLWGAHFIEDFHLPEDESIYWFGAFYAVAFLLNIVVLKFVEGRFNKNYPLILLIANGLLIIVMLAFAFSSNFLLALLTFWIAGALRDVNYPLMSVMTNERLEAQGRATALSMFGQLDAIGQIAGGPIIGLLALYTTIASGIASTVVFILPILFFLVLMQRKLAKSI